MHTLCVAAGRSLILAVVTGFLLATLRVRHPAMRKAAWAAVLMASFSMPILSGHFLHIERFAENPVSKAVTVAARSVAPVMETGRLSAEPAIDAFKIQASTRSGRVSLLGRYLLWVYWFISTVLLGRLFLGFLTALQTWRDGSPVIGFESKHIRISSQVHSPWTFCSGILLPDSAKRWSCETLQLVLAHERKHIRQGDFYLQMAARIYTAMFWFSPLGWWLQRECGRLGEQTSDYAALQIAPDPKVYAELLLQLCEQRTPAMVVSMARQSGLRPRIYLILTEGELMNRFSSPLRAGATAAFAVVIAVTIATVTPVARAAAYQQGPAVAAVPNAPSNGIKGFASSIDPQIPVVGIGGDSVIRVSSGVLTAQRVEKIRKKVGSYFLAFHEAGSDYVITDPILVHQAFAYFSPIPSETKPEPSGEPANQAPTTERERQLMQQIADLQTRLSYTQSQQKPLGSLELLSPDGRNKLQALIQQAKASGKAVRIVV